MKIDLLSGVATPWKYHDQSRDRLFNKVWWHNHDILSFVDIIRLSLIKGTLSALLSILPPCITLCSLAIYIHVCICQWTWSCTQLCDFTNQIKISRPNVPIDFDRDYLPGNNEKTVKWMTMYLYKCKSPGSIYGHFILFLS